MASLMSHPADALTELLSELSGPTAAAARHILAFPEDVAVFSMRELARRMKVPPVTLVRLAQRLDFAGYDAFKRRYVEMVRQGGAGGVRGVAASRNLDAARAITAAASQPAGTRGFVADVLAAEQELLRQVFAGLSASALEEAAGLLAGARRVFVIGRRTAFAPAFALSYTLLKARPDVVLLHDLAGAPETALEDVGEGDLLVLVTFAPFSRLALGLAKQAAASGARILAIAEAPIAPLRKIAGRLVFVAPSRSIAFPESATGALAIANLLVGLAVAKLGEAATRRIAANERRIVASGEYLLAGPAPG